MTRLSAVTLTVIVMELAAPVLAPPPAAAQQRWYAQTTPMPTGRQMYGTAVLGDFIYLIGGTEITGYATSVLMAPIRPDGQLGQWQQTTPLPAPRSYIGNSTMALNDIVYVVAGWDGPQAKASNTILWTRPRADGSLESWRESPPYPGQGTNCAVAVATPGYIHLIGGQAEGNVILPDVWSARVAPDGSIAAWEPSQALPTPLWFHCGGVAAGRVWVWGGLTGPKNDSVSATVYAAAILSSGRLGPWTVATAASLPQPFYSASSVVTGNFLLSFCPRYQGGVESNDVWFATASAQGLSPWQRLPTDLPSKLYIGLGTDYRRGFVYIPGGRKSFADRTSLDNNVYYFQLSGGQTARTTPAATATAATADAAVTIDAGPSGGASRLSYMQVGGSGGVHPGFLPYEQARQMALAQNKPLVLYFFNNRARRCEEQRQILNTFNASAWNGRIVFAEVDTVKFPQVTQQYGVFRIPHWIMFDAAGNALLSQSGVLSAQDLQGYARRLAP
ncbi:MAG: hypothetical protein Kow0059_13830 [Candidatus Sumerlaeia bacterium]